MRKYLLAVLFLSNILLGQSIIEENLSTTSFNKSFTFRNTQQNFLYLHNSESADSNNRSTYFYLTIGIAEPLAIGYGYQINNDLAVALKWSGYWLSGGGTYIPHSGTGFGLKISKNTGVKYLNNLNGEISLFYRAANDKSKTLIKGFAFDINIGNEKLTKNSINFIWSIGISIASSRDSSPLYLPQLKIGFNINL